MKRQIISEFKIPLIILFGIFIYSLLFLTNHHTSAIIVSIIAIITGSYNLIFDSYQSLLRKQYALDYIAILAIVVSFIAQQYLVGMVIALMIASGRNLEDYGTKSAKKSLTKLVDRIPKNVLIWKDGKADEEMNAELVKIGQHVVIRKGEVISLDGILMSTHAIVDESSLTGEPYPVEKMKGDIVRSGTINSGDLLVLTVTKEAKDSTYKKIINLVEKAQTEKAPLVRLADRYSTIFTITTFAIATFAYVLHPGLESILAVLVVATPCPLILATPIALLAGMNAAARKRIIIKKLASLEVLSRVNAIIFDKTGTITLGKPQVTNVIFHGRRNEKHILSIAAAIERNSLHPLAKAVVVYATSKRAPISHAKNVVEIIGKGITGEVENNIYTLSKISGNEGMEIGLYEKDKLVATFRFEDKLKQDSQKIVAQLLKQKIRLSLFTGDKIQAAKKVAALLGSSVSVKAECTPQDKQIGIGQLKKQGKITAMIGDGINDAPALAFADVGMVFSNEEQTAASEAADIVFLGGDFASVAIALTIAQRTIHIALQSIGWGIGLSIAAMIGASLGFIPPLLGAGIQEVIDVAVILNALRAAY